MSPVIEIMDFLVGMIDKTEISFRNVNKKNNNANELYTTLSSVKVFFFIFCIVTYLIF